MSVPGTTRTFRHVRSMSAIGGSSDTRNGRDASCQRVAAAVVTDCRSACAGPGLDGRNLNLDAAVVPPPLYFDTFGNAHSGRWKATPCAGLSFTYLVATISSGAARFTTQLSRADPVHRRNALFPEP
jgi:hypothetical protein